MKLQIYLSDLSIRFIYLIYLSDLSIRFIYLIYLSDLSIRFIYLIYLSDLSTIFAGNYYDRVRAVHILHCGISRDVREPSDHLRSLHGLDI